MIPTEFQLENYKFEIPPELIAQRPLVNRSESRLLAAARNHEKIEHLKFKQIVDFFMPGDVLVINSSKVIKARLFLHKQATGAKCEFLYLCSSDKPERYLFQVGNSRRATAGSIFTSIDGRLELKITAVLPEGRREVEIVSLEGLDSLIDYLQSCGEMPLPPYINSSLTPEEEDCYQTVYSQNHGSIAAPTAGLHFTEELLCQLERLGVKIIKITLHVGIGTFQPVKTEDLRLHKMHSEYFEISLRDAEFLRQAKRTKQRIIACGTTSIRVIETLFAENFARTSGTTELFIYPGFKFKGVDGIITNFHYTGSSLLMLVAAFIELDYLKKLYLEAINQKYRFYSFGDAMFLY